MGTREFDVVLFGATGFVGSLTAAHLAEAAGQARVGLAARSADRLAALRDELGGPARSWELLTVDAADAAGLAGLAARTRVLATTVGPYARYGREVVRAAAERGTHYADLTGEASFVAWTLARITDLARRTGSRVVHSCGFDSIPSDLGVLVTAERAAADGQGTLAEASLVVRLLRGGLSGGTIDSLRQEVIAARADPEVRRVVRDPSSLLPAGAPSPAPPARRSQRLRRLLPVERDPRTGRWLGPFVMAGYNTRIIQLSRALAGGSATPLRYRELSDVGRGPAGPVRAVGTGVALAAAGGALSWRPTRAVLDRFLPRPGEGPDARQRATGRFRMEIEAVTTTGARYLTTVAAGHDPGYGGTAIMLGQSALCLALYEPQLPDRTGVLTPATGLGMPLVERLRSQGFTFETEPIG